MDNYFMTDKKVGRNVKGAERRERRRKQLLGDLKETRG
jgi:hypothetical protein